MPLCRGGGDPKSTTSHPEVLVDKCADALSIPKVGFSHTLLSTVMCC